jgi:hypothetical protein
MQFSEKAKKPEQEIKSAIRNFEKNEEFVSLK